MNQLEAEFPELSVRLAFELVSLSADSGAPELKVQCDILNSERLSWFWISELIFCLSCHSIRIIFDGSVFQAPDLFYLHAVGIGGGFLAQIATTYASHLRCQCIASLWLHVNQMVRSLIVYPTRNVSGESMLDLFPVLKRPEIARATKWSFNPTAHPKNRSGLATSGKHEGYSMRRF